MKERPILFKGDMVNAILDGRKTQTRRVIKPQPFAQPEKSDDEPIWEVYAGDELSGTIKCPYGQPGDRLWVRETWRQFDASDECDHLDFPCGCPRTGDPVYRATHDDGESKWKPSIFMPRWASRITLEITDVRVERLQDISEEDAKAEGAQHFPELPGKSAYGMDCRWSMEQPNSVDQCLSSAKWAFSNYFCKINGKAPKGCIDQRPWDANPWVWVVEFRRLT